MTSILLSEALALIAPAMLAKTGALFDTMAVLVEEEDYDGMAINQA